MSPVLSTALGVIVAVLVLGLVVVLPKWAERAGKFSKQLGGASKRVADGTLARIDMAQFVAQQQLVSARERRRRMAWALKQTKRQEKNTTKALELAHKAQVRAQRSEEKMDEYRRAQARKRGRLAATIVMLVGIISVVLGATVLRASGMSSVLIGAGAVLAVVSLWMLSKISQVAKARRVAIAAGEGVFVTRGSKHTEVSAVPKAGASAEGGKVEGAKAEGTGQDAMAEAVSATVTSDAPVAPAVATAKAESRQSQRLTHAGARAAALAEAERLGLLKRKPAEAKSAEGSAKNTEGYAEDAQARAESETVAEVAAQAKAEAAQKAKAELAAASEAALEKLRQAQAQPEVTDIEETLAEKSEVEQLRGASLDAIMRNRRLG